MKKITRTLAHIAATLSLFGAGHALAQELVNVDTGSFVFPGGVDGTSNTVDPQISTGADEEPYLNPAELGSVLSLQVGFKDGKWFQISEPNVIHCRPPKILPVVVPGAEIRIGDARGQVLGRRSIDDPRLVLPEDPRSDWGRLETVEIQLLIDLVGQPARIEFFEDLRQLDVPSLSIDLTRALADFLALGGLRIPNCENADPPFVRLGNQSAFVLVYALERASQATDIPTDELLELLTQYGEKIGDRVKMPRTVEHLLLASIYEIKK